jgi:hypothetical protein
MAFSVATNGFWKTEVRALQKSKTNGLKEEEVKRSIAV